MTDKELKKLSRAELLEMLLQESRENEQLRQQLAEATEKLESKEISVDKAGSLAEAALQLNGVFDAAQAAADQYLDNLRNTEAVCEKLRSDAQQEAAKIISEAKKKAAAKEAKAKAQSEKYWADVSAKLENFYQEHQGLKELLNMGGDKKQ